MRRLCFVLGAFLLLVPGAAFAQEDLLSDPKLADTVSAFLRVAGNDENGLKNFEFISQKEVQAVLRLIHRDELTTMDLFKIKSGILEMPQYLRLMPEQRADLNRVIRDIVLVRGRMEEFETYEKFHCRFAMSDDPFDELSPVSFTRNPEKYRGQLPDETINEALHSRGERAVIGLCWLKKESDRLLAWTQEMRARKSASVFVDP